MDRRLVGVGLYLNYLIWVLVDVDVWWVVVWCLDYGCLIDNVNSKICCFMFD